MEKDYGKVYVELNSIVKSYGKDRRATAFYIRNENDFKELLNKIQKDWRLNDNDPFTGVTKFVDEDYYIFEKYYDVVRTYGDFDEYTGSYTTNHVNIQKKSIIEDRYKDFLKQFPKFIPRDEGYIAYIHNYRKDQEEALKNYGVNPKNIVWEKMHFDGTNSYEKLEEYLKEAKPKDLIIIGNLSGLGDLENFKKYYQKLIEMRIGLVIVDEKSPNKMHGLSTVDENEDIKTESELANLLLEVIRLESLEE